MKHFLTLSLFIFSISLFSQTNKEIAGVYIKKAETEFESNDINTAQDHFNKAVKFFGTIKSEEVDRLGTLINFKLGKLKQAQKFAKHYFEISLKKDPVKYEKQLELYVTIEEKLDSVSKLNEAQIEAQIARKIELKRIDSLKAVWKKQSNSLSLDIDEVKPFDKNGIAVYSKGNYYGIITDTGAILTKANTYEDYRSFDGYILLLDQVEHPFEVLCYNSNTQQSNILPKVNLFSQFSTYYNHISLPRGNNRLVTYPNNSIKTLVYDLESNSFEDQKFDKDFFQFLKKEDKISSYKFEEGLVKIDKIWYYFGGATAPGIYTLYTEENREFYGYLFHFDGKVMTKEEYGYFGTLYKNKIQTSNGDQENWLFNNGQLTESPENEAGTYTGTTKITKLPNGKLQFKKEDVIVLDDQKLESLNSFLIQNKVAKEDLLQNN